MSTAGAPPGGAGRKAAIEDQLARFMSGRLQRSEPRCEIIPTDLLQGVALSLIETRPVRTEERISLLAEGAPILRKVLAQASARRDVYLITGLDIPGGIEASRLDKAVTRLEAIDPVLAGMIEARCYGGLLPEEQPTLSGLPGADVQRRWRIARAWMQDVLSPLED